MTRDDIIRMAQQTGWDFGWEMTVEQVCEFANLVAAAERETCAKVCEELLSAVSTGDEHMDGVWDAINAIRERGQ